MQPIRSRLGQPTFLGLAIPTALVMLLGMLANIILLRFVAPLGTDGVAIVSAGQRLQLVWSSLFLGLGAAMTAMVSQAWGRADFSRGSYYTRVIVAASVVSSGILMLGIVIGSRAIASLFGFENETLEVASQYVRLLGVFTFGQLLFMILGMASRATGDAKTPMVIGILANLVGISSAYLLIHGCGVVPALGVLGVAYGWGLGFSLAGFVYLVMWLGNRIQPPFMVSASAAAPGSSRKEIGKIGRIALPATLEPLVQHFGFIVVIGMVGSYGTHALAAYGVALTLMAVLQLFGYSFSIAAATLVGQAGGSGDLGAIRQRVWSSLYVAMGVMVPVGAVMALLADEVAGFFSVDPAVLVLLKSFIILIAIFQIFEACDQVLAGSLRGLGHTGVAFRANLASLFVIRLPLAFLISAMDFSVVWLFAIIGIELVFKTILLTVAFLELEFGSPYAKGSS